MEQNKEAIALKFGLCTCDEMYTKRNMTAPDCPWHATCVDEAMEEFAKQEVLSELQTFVEMQCHPEYLKMAIIDRISEIKNPQLP